MKLIIHINNSIIQKKILGVLTLLMIILSSCKTKTPQVDNIDVDFKLIPFYEDIFSVNPDSLETEKQRLINDYGKYFEAYCMRIVMAGSPYRDKDFSSKMKLFLTYKENLEVLDTCRKVFNDLTGLKDELTRGFRFYSHYFPKAVIPDVYMHISGFNQSIIVDSSWVSVSVEKYLGSNCVFYEWLSVPVYLRRGMTPEKVAPDVMKAIAMSQFTYNDSIDNLLSQIVYQGMIQYFLKQVMPEQSDEHLFNYSRENLEWCYHYEEMMWAAMIERKHLFNSESLMIQKYVGEAPFSSYYGPDSPGRTGIFIGYRIIESFMKKNPEVSLSDLMNIRDYNKILSKSGYRP